MMLFGALQSRYAYISSAFLAAAVMNAAAMMKRKHLSMAIMTILVVSHGWFAFQRSRLWLDAYRCADSLKTDINSIHIPEDMELVIVNLPGQCGSKDIIWKPFLWHNGMSAFKRNFIRIRTPDSLHVTPNPAVPVLTDTQILAQFRDARIYRVTAEGDSCSDCYEITPMDKGPESRLDRFPLPPYNLQ